MKLDFKDVQENSFITLVSNGYTKSLYSSYISTYKIGETTFLKVLKKGRKYLTCYYVRFDNGEMVVNTNFETIQNPTEKQQLIFSGIRQDIEEQFQKYQKAIREYEEKQMESSREIERKLREIERILKDKWRKDNPFPDAPKINTYQ